MKKRSRRAATPAPAAAAEAPPKGKPGTWPDEAPILLAEDFCRGQPDKGAQHDLGGWLEEVFEPGCIFYAPCRAKAYNVLLGLVVALGHPAVWVCNDDPNVTDDDLARIWRQMLEKLGYEVGAQR